MADHRMRQALSEPDFWTVFFDDYAPGFPSGDVDVDAEDDHSVVAEYDVGGGYALLVHWGPWGITLKLSHPGAARPVKLDWDDRARWRPHALRWSEIDMVCRATALTDPDVAYPGPYLAFLGRFAPVCTETDAAVAVPLLGEAFAALPGLDRYQRRSYASRCDLRGSGVRWKQDGSTGWWYPDQDEEAGEEGDGPYRGDPDAKDYPACDLYSTRVPSNPKFPFAALAAGVDQARARCAALRDRPWAVEAAVQVAAEAFGGHPSAMHRAGLVDALRAAGCADRAVLGALAPEAGELRALVMAELLLGVEPGNLVRAWSGPEAPRPLRCYKAHVHLPVAWRHATDDGPASELQPHLDAALRTAGLGTTRNGPIREGRRDGSWVDDLPLELIDDWRAAVELVCEVLRTAGAPEGSTVEVGRRGGTVTVDLEQPLPDDMTPPLFSC